MANNLSYWNDYFQKQAIRGKKLLNLASQYGGASETPSEQPLTVKFISPVQKTVNMVEARMKNEDMNATNGSFQTQRLDDIKRRRVVKKKHTTQRKRVRGATKPKTEKGEKRTRKSNKKKKVEKAKKKRGRKKSTTTRKIVKRKKKNTGETNQHTIFHR